MNPARLLPEVPAEEKRKNALIAEPVRVRPQQTFAQAVSGSSVTSLAPLREMAQPLLQHDQEGFVRANTKVQIVRFDPSIRRVSNSLNKDQILPQVREDCGFIGTSRCVLHAVARGRIVSRASDAIGRVRAEKYDGRRYFVRLHPGNSHHRLRHSRGDHLLFGR